MLYGRRLDQSLEHVEGSRYALVHAVAKRARQITLWLTADPAELRAESAPPPAPGELVSRDPVALAEAEILNGEVRVRWDPGGRAEEAELLEEPIEADPLLLEGLTDDEVGDGDSDIEESDVTPALAQVLEGETEAGEDEEGKEVEGDGDEEVGGAGPELEVVVDDDDDDGDLEEVGLEDVEVVDDDEEEETEV